MPEFEVLSHLIGEIYDAALMPSLWDDLIPRAAILLGGSGAGLYSKNIAAQDIQYFYAWNVDQIYLIHTSRNT